MPPGRPKRPAELEGEPLDGPKCKMPKMDRGSTPTDFSTVVKNKLSSYSRTGQACDRCKVRKIRCDALPEGCSHCLNQNLECYVTDRVTGRTERRGYMQQLEREKVDMLTHIRDLEKLLKSTGVAIKPWPSPNNSAYPPDATYDSSGSASQSENKEDWTQRGASLWVKDLQAKSAVSQSSRPMLEARPADVHLGVGNDQAPLSSINGTTLSILGSTIDIGSFDAPDMDEPAPGTQAKSPLYNKSMQAYMQSCTNVNPQLHVESPPRADAFTYAEWYFLILYPFLPVLHKPSFMALLTRLYDDPNFQPTVAQLVIVHMVFASIYMQYGIRNRENPEQKERLNDLSNKHYHFSLSKYFDLMTSKTFEDLQALTMIAVHTRSFPKPDCASMATWTCHAMAVELGLHRAVKKPGEGPNLTDEMRKRVWWTIVEIGVTLNGRKGRPMPIRLEEIDVGFPEMIPDELLTEDGVDTSRTGKCLYETGIAGFKMAAIYLEMYSTIYCAKRDPTTYPQIIGELEARVSAWQDELPESLKPSGGNESPNEMFALYAQYVVHEFRLCLRHPSVAMTNDPKLMAENSIVCEKAAKNMLTVAHKLYKLKSQDSTWYALSEYVAAMFTSLVAVWERRHSTTADEVASLREDMNTWLIILNETCDLIGCGSGLRDAVASIVNRTLAWIEHDRQRKVGSTSTPKASANLVKQSPSTSSYSGLSHIPTSNVDPALSAGTAAPAPDLMSSARNEYYADSATEASAYPPLPYSEPNGQASDEMSYDPRNAYLYASGGQVAAAHPQAHTQVPTQGQVTDHNALSGFANQAAQMSQPRPEMLWRQETPGGSTWHDWTAAVVDNQERHSADALMSLGAAARHSVIVNDGSTNAPSMGMGVGGLGAPNVAPSANMQWPLLLFHDGGGVGGT